MDTLNATLRQEVQVNLNTLALSLRKYLLGIDTIIESKDEQAKDYFTNLMNSYVGQVTSLRSLIMQAEDFENQYIQEKLNEGV